MNRLLPCTIRRLASVLALALASGQAPAAAPMACTMVPAASLAYMGRTVAAAQRLRIPVDYPTSHRLTLQPEATGLVDAGSDIYGRRLRLAPGAARALAAMTRDAARVGVTIQAVSGFRSFGYQRQLLQAKLRRGMAIGAALRINTAPGFSEHHSGCAVDLTTLGVAPADAAFADSAAYRWLAQHAGAYGFHLSYAANNPHGIDFEPWHWRFLPPPSAAASVDASPERRALPTLAAPSAAERRREADLVASGVADVSTDGVVPNAQ